ncbi:hypothetical protein [Hymenobacter metallilatus]|uniref:Carboxypeptidase regulatory-like domain-containing protein n=1 Tax=Hymenobacter metallilatus TaxID=2493666 RepID=A0A3R9NEU5_9BACT|nr:hypothetical protein [Hymenobacter metallilatus]RSK32505.1 hypothetical protein EI290_12310 [Hymenobacter metallilatus]
MKACLLIIMLAIFHTAVAQRNTDTLNTTIVLSDINVQGYYGQLVVASGIEKNNTWHSQAPGGGYAVRFQSPQAGYHKLRQIRVHLYQPSRIREGQLRVRVASVTAAKGPASDNLLPEPVLLTTKILRASRKHLTIQWPTAQLLVPDQGFFIVIEGIGNYPDEYVSGLEPQMGKPAAPRYQLRRRIDSSHTLRTAPITDFPILKGTQVDTKTAESWYLDAVTQEWHYKPSESSVVLLEAIFE